jgi:hypothetical protein
LLDSLQEVLGGLRPGRGRLARDRGGGEVALGIALAAEVEVVVPVPKEATPVKGMSLLCATLLYRSPRFRSL